MRLKKLVLATSIVGVLAVGGGAALAAAQGGGASPVGDGGSSSVTATNPSLKLKKTWVVSDSGQAAAPAGFSSLHAPITITCPANRTCTIVAEQSVQVNSGTAANQWAICSRVDGNEMSEPSCPFVGAPTANEFTAASFVQSQSGLAAGNHTVETRIFASSAMTRSIYTITYSLYTQPAP